MIGLIYDNNNKRVCDYFYFFKKKQNIDPVKCEWIKITIYLNLVLSLFNCFNKAD